MFKIYSALLLVAGASAVLAQSPQSAPRARSVIIHRFVQSGWLGVGFAELTPERAAALKVSGDDGVEVFKIVENSPASRAGLKAGDVITQVDGHKVSGVEQFMRAIGETAPGTKINLEVWHGGAKQSLTATVEARPVQYGLPMPVPAMPFEIELSPNIDSPRLGYEGETLTPQLAQFFGVKEGVLVRTVWPKTPAEKAGLKAGDIIFKVSGTPVSSPREISGLVHASHKTATFTVMRNHKEILLNVEIAADRIQTPGGEVL